MPNACLGTIAFLQGRTADAIRWLEQTTERSNRSPWHLGPLAMAYGADGRTDAVREIQEELMHLSAQGRMVAVPMAYTHLGLGEKGQAFDWLEKAIEQGDPMVLGLNYLHLLQSLRSEPRFQELIRRLNFPE